MYTILLYVTQRNSPFKLPALVRLCLCNPLPKPYGVIGNLTAKYVWCLTYRRLKFKTEGKHERTTMYSYEFNLTYPNHLSLYKSSCPLIFMIFMTVSECFLQVFSNLGLTYQRQKTAKPYYSIVAYLPNWCLSACTTLRIYYLHVHTSTINY